MRPRHLRALAAAVAARSDLRGVVHVSVRHDDACTPSRCVCEPEIVIEEGTEENLARGAEEQAKWIRETSS